MIATPKIKVMIVDDAVVIRRMLTVMLEEDPELEVVATAANGHVALAKLDSVRPDVVVLDVEMPVMDGLATLREMRKRGRHVPVIMFSTLTERGAAVTLDALALGASDYVTKPSNTGSFGEARQRIRAELIPKIKALCRRHPAQPALRRRLPSAERRGRLSGGPIEAVVIGVSTGGPNALAEVIPRLPRDFPVPIFIVQHMPPVFTRLLAERLDARSPLQVREARDGDSVRPGTVWIAPGDYHMVVRRERTDTVVRLNQEPPVNFCRPAADVLFESAAEVYGGQLLAVVLTGMGHDGQRGCERIKAAGGTVIAQDEATSVVWGMPGAVARAGLADYVLPLNEIAGQIIRTVQHRRSITGAACRFARSRP